MEVKLEAEQVAKIRNLRNLCSVPIFFSLWPNFLQISDVSFEFGLDSLCLD